MTDWVKKLERDANLASQSQAEAAQRMRVADAIAFQKLRDAIALQRLFGQFHREALKGLERKLKNGKDD
jgi:hypothetical protein